jgi:hypothetical protein
MTVGELRKALEGAPDEMEVAVYDEELKCAQPALIAEIARIKTYRQVFLEDSSPSIRHFLISGDEKCPNQYDVGSHPGGPFTPGDPPE